MRIHYRVFGTCVSYVAACTLKWCYDSKPELPLGNFSDSMSNVTCKRCLKRLAEWGKSPHPVDGRTERSEGPETESHGADT